MLVWLVEHRMGPVEVSAACAQSPNSSSLRRAKERSVQFQVLPQEAQHLSCWGSIQVGGEKSYLWQGCGCLSEGGEGGWKPTPSRVQFL